MDNAYVGKIHKYHVIQQTICSHCGFAGPFSVLALEGENFGSAFIYIYDGSSVLLPKKDDKGAWVIYFPTSFFDRILHLLETRKDICLSVTENDVAYIFTAGAPVEGGNLKLGIMEKTQ